MEKSYIGVTGFTTAEDVAIMTDALNGNLGMYGVLISHNTLKMKIARGRYAALNEISGLMKRMPENSLRTLHWCDGHWRNRENPWKSIEDAISSAKGECNAIQLNMEYPPVKFFEDLKEKYGLKTIFQIEAQMFEDPAKMREKIEPYAKFVDYVIIDQSMGAGIPLNKNVSRAVAKEIQSLDIKSVLAGGLYDQTVPDVGDLIREYDMATDAEGKLMNERDVLDHPKVRKYTVSVINEKIKK